MHIRDAAEDDLPAIVEIYNAAIATRLATAQLEPVSVPERLPWFYEHSADRHPLLVMEVAQQIAGWLSFHPFTGRSAYRNTAEVSVYVHEEFRRRGLATALLKDAITRSGALELTALIGLILGHNRGSLELFERAGFERWGVLPRVVRLDGHAGDVVIVGREVGA